MHIDRNQYAFAHGKQPRGYGLWLFRMSRNGASTGFEHTGNFGDALAAAKREARALGCTTIVVCS